MFCISVLSLCGYHTFLVSRNQTTLESFRAPIFRHNLAGDKKGFFLGHFSNFQEVFGDNKLLWFLPIFTSFGDGLVYPQRGQANIDEEQGLPRHNNVGTSEELVPMINATIFEDDESDEENNVWTDQQNQRTLHQFSSTSSSEDDKSTAVLNIDDQAQVSLKSPKLKRFETGSTKTTAITGDLITVDTI